MHKFPHTTSDVYSTSVCHLVECLYGYISTAHTHLCCFIIAAHVILYGPVIAAFIHLNGYIIAVCNMHLYIYVIADYMRFCGYVIVAINIIAHHVCILLLCVRALRADYVTILCIGSLRANYVGTFNVSVG